MALAADSGLLIVYAAVAGYFLRRYFKRRVTASLYVSLLPFGWILIGVRGLVGGSIPLVLKFAGIVAGSALLYSVLSTDRREKK